MNFFDTIIDLITHFAVWLSNMATMLIAGVEMLLASVVVMNQFTAIMPGFLAAFTLALFAIAVIKFLLGR